MSVVNPVVGPGPIRIALVGAGRIGQSHLEALSSVGDAALTAIVEPREAAGAAAAEQKHVRWFRDATHPELLDLVDAVVLCTPPNTHFELSRHFLSRGRHVLCEKPLTLRSQDARELLRLADESRLLLMMASKFRYADDVIKAKAILEAGLLGRIALFENSFCGRVLMKDRWNSRREISGGGVLIDNGTHSVDIARYLLGPLQQVQAHFGLSAQGLEVEDTVRLGFRTRRGAIGTADLSWSINKESDWYIGVHGLEGTLLVGWTGSRYRLEGSSKWVPFGAGYDKAAALRRQLDNFVGALRGREAPLVTVEDALASVQVIEAAYQSAGSGRWLEVGEVSQ